ncbi:hypothetical protein [Cellulosimicrobium composti]|uniref:WxL domain-containing protein n=1 Tax=Cellulosimicrobium composti TaxID=2672572 RepID=A0ABX0BF10_9MICO|nr:hypothetical protein [Cellulosimicrobium composti]NDO90721.1 hypothetical protein [Cellulosimicrobium composti]TWG81271.1 hypothetical protein L603_003400000160 [Cellulosimicrobium cellulans J34]SMF48204.1 hypothetical protein SAMN02744115_03544 [Cellulosimicrobium cellulans J1]
MNARATKKLVAGGALGAMLIGTVALASAASADQVGDDSNVDVSVEIESTVEPGNLAFSVASSSTTLSEVDSTVPETREFTGTLPEVTVTDTRSADQIAENSFWYVLGSASDFTGEAGTIGAENLGWAPALVSGSDSGLVEAGEGVDPELENGPGLVDQDLLVSAFDSTEVNPEGSWTANADLTLRTGEDVAAGAYSSTITLSLFEDIG